MKRLCSWWGETVNWWKSQKVEWYAGYGTAIYIGIIILIVAARLDELFKLKLNEIGDFLAGAFGPVAFLWLVLGFIQQGRELKLSSDALRLQAEQLKNSVEQQSIMAAAATDQLAAQQQAFELQVWRHQHEISPNFEVKIFQSSLPGLSQVMTSVMKVHNAGHSVRLVSAIFDEFLGGAGPFEIGDLKEGETSSEFSLSHGVAPEGVSGKLYLEYVRADNKLYRDTFHYGFFADTRQFFIMKSVTKPA